MEQLLAGPSLEQLKKAIVIREKIQALEAELIRLIGTSENTSQASRRFGGRVAAPTQRRRKMPAAARAKLAAIARRRWAKAKAAGKMRL